MHGPMSALRVVNVVIVSPHPGPTVAKAGGDKDASVDNKRIERSRVGMAIFFDFLGRLLVMIATNKLPLLLDEENRNASS